MKFNIGDRVKSLFPTSFGETGTIVGYTFSGDDYIVDRFSSGSTIGDTTNYCDDTDEFDFYHGMDENLSVYSADFLELCIDEKIILKTLISNL